MTGPSDAVRAGRAVPFEDYFAANAVHLARLARVLCGDRDVGEDVLQDVLIRAYGQWPRISAMERPDAYLRRMIVNEHLSWRRASARRRVREQADSPPHGPDPAISIADHAQVISLLADLPDRQRTAIVLRYFSDLTDAQIADAMSCSASAVRAYISRALAAMRLAPDLCRTIEETS